MGLLKQVELEKKGLQENGNTRSKERGTGLKGVPTEGIQFREGIRTRGSRGWGGRASLDSRFL